MTQPLLIFVHIPKTAGMTMRDTLERQYGVEACYFFTDNDLQFNSSSPQEIQRNLQGKLVVYGHLSYGFHQYIEQPYQYMTILRHPISQVISLINHNRRAAKANGWDGLLAFVRERRQSYSNWQCKMLTGADLLYTERKLTRADLEAAKQRLRDEFSLLGLAERFDESLLYFQRKLGWHTPYYIKTNVSQRYLRDNTIEYADLTGEERQIVHEWNAYDIELYDYACALFDERLAEIGGISDFQLQRYALQNRLYYWRTVAPRRLRRFVQQKA